MISRSLNSGAINAVQFPSAEQGASVIELSGVIEVTASISSLGVKIGVQPAPCVAAAAPSGIRTTVRTTASAISSASALQSTPQINVKIERGGQVACAATVTSAILFKRRLEALSTASAVAAVNAVGKGAVGATTTASADSSAQAISNLSLAGAAVAQAMASDVIALNGVRLSGQGTAGVGATATPGIKLRIGATTQCTSAFLVGAQRVSHRAAQGVCAAQANAAASNLRLSPGATTAPAAVASVAARSRIMFTGTAQPGASSRPTLVGVKRGIAAYAQPLALASSLMAGIKGASSAYGQARAIGQASALDLSINVSAPMDRQIEVPFYDRTMKVMA